MVTFDQPMNRRGYSFCGGGPKFPKALRSRWKDKFTCIMTVELEPDHDYELSLNCPAANNFRSAKGVQVYCGEASPSFGVRFEPRPRWPAADNSRARRLHLTIKFLEGRRHLPVVELTRAA